MLKTKNSRIMAIVLIAAALVAVVIVGFTVNSSERKLKKQLDLAQQYMDEMNYEQAVAAYLVAIEIDENCEEAYIGAANAYLGLDDMEGAISILEKGYDTTQGADIKKLLDELNEKVLQEEKAQKIADDTENTDLSASEQNNEQQSNNANIKKDGNKNDVYSGEYDESKLEYLTDTDWFVTQVIDDGCIVLQYPAKGDLPLLFINADGDIIYEGLTDSFYGESYITEYEGKPAIVDLRMEDFESNNFTRTLLDMKGNVIKEESLTLEDDSWNEVLYDVFPYVDSAEPSERLSVENTEDGVYVYDAQGNQIACFLDANEEGAEVGDWYQEYPICGEIKGEYLIISQIVAAQQTEEDEYAEEAYESIQTYIYKIK